MANKPAYLITLSAKTEESLKQRIADLENWLSQSKEVFLEDIGYTLNIGRSHFEKRCAIVANSLDELSETLQQLNENQKVKNAFIKLERKDQPENQAIFKKIFKQIMQEMQQTEQLSAADYRDNLLSLANFYAEGYDLDWDLLHQGEGKRKISLPTYPFAKERYWVESVGTLIDTTSIIPMTTGLHPLIDSNISTLSTQSFTKVFTGKEFYLDDHRVQSNPVLPGVAYIEMARAAGALATPDKRVVGLRNMIWASPIVITNGSQMVTVSLYAEEQGVTFEINTADGKEITAHVDGHTEPIVHAQGKILYASSSSIPEPAKLDISAIQTRCTQGKDREEIYSYFTSIGMHYGKSFQVIEELFGNEKEAIATLHLPKDLVSDRPAFGLHPSLMDGALQAVIGISEGQGNKTLYLPFSIGQVDIFGTLPD